MLAAKHKTVDSPEQSALITEISKKYKVRNEILWSAIQMVIINSFKRCRLYSAHTTLDSFSTPTKTIPDGASVHTQEQLWWRNFCDREKLRRDNP